MVYDHFKRSVIFYTNVVGSCFSLMGCIGIIFVFFKFKQLRKLPSRLIFYMIVSDFFHSIGMILPYYENDVICQLQGFVLSYFSLSTVLCSACIAHAIYWTILHRGDVEKYEKFYLVLCFLVPCLCFLSNIYEAYSVSLGWCWISQSTNEKSEGYYVEIVMRMVSYYIPLCIVYVFNTIAYIKVINFLKTSKDLVINDKELKENLILKLKLYPVILVFCQSPVLLIRVASFFVTPQWYFLVIAGGMDSINGFLNAIVYGITNQVRQQLKDLRNGKRVSIAESLNLSIDEEELESLGTV